MRVIAGVARRLELKTVPGSGTRPTTDRIKETLFNILNPDLYQCHFLDLFAGSGAIGIEALSRGAREAVFVEQNPEACHCIRHNLNRTGLEERGRLFQESVATALRRLALDQQQFSWIFMDPPYGQGMERQVLTDLSQWNLLTPQGRIVVEARLGEDFSYVESLGFEITRVKEYKTNEHVFLRKKGEA